MTKPKITESEHIKITRDAILAAALPHVTFDGWASSVLDAAIADSGVDAGLAALAFPRGVLDLALAFHFDGDAAMLAALAARDLGTLRYRDRVALAVETRLRIAAPHKEAVRRGMAFFALPHHAADGARALWHTSDAIWQALGDTSRDVNWYTKRMTLSAVYSACALFWLGDDSDDMAPTLAFIDRRIDDVMRFEKAKATFRNSPMGKVWAAGPGRLLDKVHAPEPRRDMPGFTGE